MKDIKARDGYCFLYNGNIIREMCANDSFDMSQLREITDAEARELMLRKYEEYIKKNG